MIIKGKTAFITGGASGIGLATARRLAREGASVAIADLDTNALDRARKEVGEKTLALTVNVTEEDQLREALERTVKELGHLDIVHNNAGIGTGPPGYPLVEIDQWKRVLDIDLYAVILGCHLAAPLMERSGGGVIINTASMAGLYPHPTDPIYGSAKAGVVAFTYALAPWAAQRKIRVNCVCPGIVDTPLVQRGQEARAKAGLPTLAPAKMLNADQIADAVMELISDDSIIGRALEIRPSGRRLVESPRMPGARG